MNGERTADIVLALPTITSQNISALLYALRISPKTRQIDKNHHMFYTRDEAEVNDLYTTYIVLSLKCLKI